MRNSLLAHVFGSCAYVHIQQPSSRGPQIQQIQRSLRVRDNCEVLRRQQVPLLCWWTRSNHYPVEEDQVIFLNWSAQIAFSQPVNLSDKSLQTD